MTDAVMEIPQVSSGAFQPPTLILAVSSGDPDQPSKAEQVLGWIGRLLAGMTPPDGQPKPVCRTVRTIADTKALFSHGGFTGARTVCLYDGPIGRKHLVHVVASRGDQMHAAALDSAWGIVVGTHLGDNHFQGAAEQLIADFVKNFLANLEKTGVPDDTRQGAQVQQWYPYGLAPRGQIVSPPPALPDMTALRELLESGPDLTADVAANVRNQLPDTKLSWQRLCAKPVILDGTIIGPITVDAFGEFELAARRLVETNLSVQQALMASVEVDGRLQTTYLYPASDGFTIRRLDLHVGWNRTGDKLVVYASESDDMPGGMVQAYHLDASFGLNQGRWTQFWDDLTSGRTEALVFLVADDWSAQYLTETKWVAEKLTSLGYLAYTISASQVPDAITFRPDGLFIAGHRISTINRLFPIFETSGPVVDIVLAAQSGLVRLTPEFAFYGNKALFALFRTHAEYFRKTLSEEAFALLEQVIPDSHLIQVSGGRVTSGFPFTVRLAGGDSITVESLEHLRRLPPSVRSELVLKVAGAGPLASRMKGILMGNELPDSEWHPWINERVQIGPSFLVQERRRSAVLSAPVLNQFTGRSELFRCRALVRPWAYRPTTGEPYLLSATATLVPRDTERVHGMVSMALVSCDFGGA